MCALNSASSSAGTHNSAFTRLPTICGSNFATYASSTAKRVTNPASEPLVVSHSRAICWAYSSFSTG